VRRWILGSSVLVIIALALAASGSAVNGIQGPGPCSQAHIGVEYVTEASGHGFTGAPQGWASWSEDERDNSHSAWSYGIILSSHHPTCGGSGGGGPTPPE